MTVVQLGPYPPPHGGVQTNLVAIRQHLRRHGIAAPVINLTRHRRRDEDDVFYPKSALALALLLVRMRADIVHLHIGGHLTPRLLALCFLCSLLPGRRVVLTFHSGGYPSWAGDNAHPRSLRGFVLRRLDAVIAVNRQIAELFARLGVPRARIHVISPYSALPVPSVELPDELRAFREAHRPLLTTIGLLEPEYDLPAQIRSMAAIRREFPDAGLVIVGSGSLHDDLRAMIASIPEAPHVLLCGDVRHDVTLKLLSESDAFLRTTLYDGDSVSVREALHLRVPVIATDNGMRPAGVHLIPTAGSESLCAALMAVLGKQKAKEEERYRAAGTTDAAEQSLDRVLDVYFGLLKRTQAVRRAPVEGRST